MPNHVINELVFTDLTEADRDRVVTAIYAGDNVDFEILVPMPLNMWWGAVGSNHEAAFKRTGLDWARENWGTKWNAYRSVAPEWADGVLTIRFQSAWSPPYPWLAAVFNKLNLPFAHNWLDEGAERGWIGTFSIDEPIWGIEWKEVEATDEMQRHLHKLLWGVEQFEDESASA